MLAFSPTVNSQFSAMIPVHPCTRLEKLVGWCDLAYGNSGDVPHSSVQSLFYLVIQFLIRRKSRAGAHDRTKQCIYVRDKKGNVHR